MVILLWCQWVSIVTISNLGDEDDYKKDDDYNDDDAYNYHSDEFGNYDDECWSFFKIGIVHLVFPRSGNHYTWHKVMTTVHNIIVGQLWVDNHGETDIINHKTGDQCHLKYNAYSYFSRDTPPRKVGNSLVSSKYTLGAMISEGFRDERNSGKVCWPAEYLVEGCLNAEAFQKQLSWWD